MIQFFKQLFKKHPKGDNAQAVLRKVRRILEVPEGASIIEYSRTLTKEAEDKKYNIAYFQMNRHYLFSLAPKDFDNVFDGMDGSQRRAYLANASLVWANPTFINEVKHMIAMQSVYVSSKCQNWDQNLVGRGTINGAGLFEERFKLLHSMHLENIKSPNVVEGNGIAEDVIPTV